jgi:hypothetical protein
MGILKSPEVAGMFSESYVRLILAVAPFVVCLALRLDPRFKGRALVWLGGALLFTLGVTTKGAASWACVPWFFLAILNAGESLSAFSRKPARGLPGLAVLASDLYLPVGAAWALFDLFDLQPLGFSGIIVLLTGVHFHYAGFALPRLTGLWLAEQKGQIVFQMSTWGVIAGVPLVAIGITTSQMRMSPVIELVAVTILALSALTVSLGQATWALRSSSLPLASRVLFGVGGLCLAGGMVLATIYGWRSVYPVAWATIPAMYAIHGTLNSLGFCLPGFLAWHLVSRGRGQSG